MTTITIGQHSLSYTVKYSKRRKTGQLKIINAHALEVTVPYKTSEIYIKNLLKEKSSWILKRILHLAQIDLNPLNKSLCNGSQLLYFGTPRTLSLLTADVQHPVISLDIKYITVRLPIGLDTHSVLLKYALKEWFIQNAEKILRIKTMEWSEKIGVMPEKIRIKEQKTRWGSCSSLRAVNYNWRIIMSPPEVIDYLVVHELCHLKFLNHSVGFWRLVARYLPDFKLHRAWLKSNGNLLWGIL